MLPIRIGILGTGYMALNAYLPGFRRNGAEIKAIWGRNEELVKEIAKNSTISNIYSNEIALINDPDVDAVVIATPNYLHHQSLEMTALAGKAVLCEKPLGMNLEQAKKMQTNVKQAKIFNVVPFIWRLPDHAQEIKSLIEEGHLGQIYECHGIFSVGLWASDKISLGWRGKKEFAGAGVLADLGGHLTDLARWYVGEFDQVIGQASTHIPIRQISANQTENINVFDTCNLLVKFEDGALGSFQMSYVDISRGLFLRFELHGSHGAIHYELEMKNDSVFTRLGLCDAGKQELAWSSKTSRFAEIIDKLCAGFLAGVQTGESELPSVTEGVASQAVIEAAIDSINNKQWESV